MEKAIIFEAWEYSNDREKVVLLEDYEKLWGYKEQLESKLKSMVSSSDAIIPCPHCEGEKVTILEAVSECFCEDCEKKFEA